jgi:hypothetical protein
VFLVGVLVVSSFTFGQEGDYNFFVGDYNADGKLDLADAIGVLQYLFVGGPPPAEPNPENVLVAPGDMDVNDLVLAINLAQRDVRGNNNELKMEDGEVRDFNGDGHRNFLDLNFLMNENQGIRLSPADLERMSILKICKNQEYLMWFTYKTDDTCRYPPDTEIGTKYEGKGATFDTAKTASYRECKESEDPGKSSCRDDQQLEKNLFRNVCTEHNPESSRSPDPRCRLDYRNKIDCFVDTCKYEVFSFESTSPKPILECDCKVNDGSLFNCKGEISPDDPLGPNWPIYTVTHYFEYNVEIRGCVVEFPSDGVLR